MLLGPIDAIRVFTFDMRTARPFYTDTLGLKAKLTTDEIAIFDTGGARLILETANPDDADERELVGRFVGLSFAVDNIDSVCTELQNRGARLDDPPAQQDWGGTLAHIRDPDGNVLTLVQYP